MLWAKLLASTRRRRKATAYETFSIFFRNKKMRREKKSLYLRLLPEGFDPGPQDIYARENNFIFFK